MWHPPDPEMRRAAVTSGSPNRKARPSRAKQNEYADCAIVSSVSVCSGRLLLGHVFETDAGQYRAVAPDGLIIGSYPSRVAAARAFSEVRP
jgi:hypothetical protein